MSAASLQILEMFDVGREGDTWAAANSDFQRAISREQWTSVVRTMRAPVGTLKTRTIGSLQFTKRIAGQPDGDYAEIIYDSTFTKISAVGEKVILQRLDGKWYLAGYFVGKHFIVSRSTLRYSGGLVGICVLAAILVWVKLHRRRQEKSLVEKGKLSLPPAEPS